MGLYRRGSVWWMDFVYKGKRVRQSTETEDRKLAQKIYDKVKGQVAEGKWFERLPGEDKTFKEMMEKFENEHVSQKRSARSFKGYVRNLKSFFGECIVSEITPAMINEFKSKRRKEGVTGATINRHLDNHIKGTWTYHGM